MAGVSGLGNVAYGVGEYKDVGDVFVYRLNQDITDESPATVQTGINAWGATGGGDKPEAQLYALDQVANTVNWLNAIPPVSSSGSGMLQATILPDPPQLPRRKLPLL